MPLKIVDQIPQADARYTGLVVADGVRPSDLAAHHAAVAQIALRGASPDTVRDAFDRAHDLVLYSKSR